MNQQANSQHYCLLQYFIEQNPPFGVRQVFGLVVLNGARHMIKSAPIKRVDEQWGLVYTQQASYQLGELITDEAEKFLYRRVFCLSGKKISDVQISTEVYMNVH